MNATAAPICILRLPEVLNRVGLGKTTLYSRIAEGNFPGPVSLGGRSVGWVESEVNGWLAAQIAVSRGQATLVSAARAS
jgi:prophage regulatory protein